MENIKTKISTEFIKLDQLLKFSGIAESGSDAKDMVSEEIVFVNDELCTMRGKKLHPGDRVRVEFDDETVTVDVE